MLAYDDSHDIENSYAQLLISTGIPGLALTLLIVGILALQCLEDKTV